MAQQIVTDVETFAQIKVIGVGGAGGAAVNRMIQAGVSGVEFVAINTDAQALHHSLADKKIHIGEGLTRGLGAGADPKVGEEAAMSSIDDIKAMLEGSDMVFVTIGAGGGTGTGAGHVVAGAAKEMGILVVGFATKPFMFEGQRRMRNAEYGINKLSKNVDILVTIPNEKLLQTIDRQTSFIDAFKIADDVLRQGVQGISDLITVHGVVNLDFADVRSVMTNAGSALMGIGRAAGDDRAVMAAKQAVESPLLDISIDGARGILFNVIGGVDMSMHDINAAAETITSAADSSANIIFGATVNPDLKGEIIVTVVATGFDESYNSANRTASGEEDLEDDKDEDSDLLAGDTEEQEHLSNPVDQNDIEEIASRVDTTLQEEGSVDKSVQESFNDDEESTPGAIWDTEEDQELDKPTFLRRVIKRKK